ncbi:MAG: hypothetical protein LUD81_09340 [Clostridiales bacterium]|nr:hypothetical protein [Clostridiales bacterium]
MTFKDLSFGKKIEHIWEYYKVHIITVIVLLFIGGTWLYDAKLKPRKELYSGVAMLDYCLPEFYEDTLYDYVNGELGLTDTNTEVTVNYFYDDPGETDFLSGMLEKFAAMLLTGDVNIMVMDKDSMEEYAAEDYLLDLSSVCSNDELNKMKDEGLLLKSSTELVPEEKYYAVSLKNSACMAELPDFDEENYYIAIYGAVEDAEHPKEVLDVILEEKNLLP